VKQNDLDSYDVLLKFRDEIVLSRGGCDTPTRTHPVSMGVFVIVHKYFLFLEFLVKLIIVGGIIIYK
jgi:hypothetical protein